MQDTPCLRLERVRIHLFQLLVRGIQRKFVDFIRNREILNTFLEFSDFFFGGRDYKVDSIDFGWLGLATDEINVDVIRNLYVSVCDGLEEC